MVIDWSNEKSNRPFMQTTGFFPLLAVPFALQAKSWGPIAVGSGPPFDSRRWIAYVDGTGAVYTDIAAVGDTEYSGNPTLQLQLPFFEDIVHMGLSFDRHGQIVLCYETAGEQLGLWWYDQAIGSPQLIENLGSGKRPFVDLEDKRLGGIDDPSTYIFYTRGPAIYYRDYNDDFEVEYSTPVENLQGVQIREVGMTGDYRYQVHYR